MRSEAMRNGGFCQGGGLGPAGARGKRLAATVGFLVVFAVLDVTWGLRPPAAGSRRLAAAEARKAENADAAPPLRYGWKAGQILAYSVTIEADRGDSIEILQGMPTYTVRSANQDEIKVDFRGTLTESQKRKAATGPPRFGPFGPPLRPPSIRRPIRPPFRPSLPSPFSPLGGVGIGGFGRGSEITFNPRGQIITITGKSQLPYLLGNLSQLMLERLPEGNEKTWEAGSDVAISTSISRLPHSMLLAQGDETSTRATEKTIYAINKVGKETVLIKKSYELKSAATVGGKPKYQIIGQGTLTFDLKRGTPAVLEFDQRVITREGNLTEETPVKVSYQLLDGTERKAPATAVPPSGKKPAGKGPPGKRAAKPLDASTREQLLADLKSGDQGRLLKALLQLQQISPEKADHEVAGAIAAYLEHEDRSTRFTAARALQNWATSKTVPALLKALDDDFLVVRMSVMNTLGRLKEAKAVEPIAARLASYQDRVVASRVLQEMGSVAEAAVSKRLKHEEWQARYEACKILGKIGTKKSVPALKKALDDSNPLVQSTAQRAIAEIEGRK